LGEGAARVVADAVRLARKSGSAEITTAQLFAAMVSGSDAHLRNALSKKGIPPDRLAGYLTKLLPNVQGTNGSNSGTATAPLTFSRNAEAILLRAIRLAAGHSECLSELDLLEAFLEQKDSSVREVLRAFGVGLSDLDPFPRRSGSSPLTSNIQIGPVREKDCAPELWASLLQVIGNRGLLTTADLIAGPLAQTLERFGINGDIVNRTQPIRACRDGTEIECSKNAREILSKALTIARPHRIDTPALLNAFIESGGGSSADVIRARGIKLQWLTSGLFVDHGRLDVGRLAEAERPVLESALELARYRGDSVLCRDHLLYALLSLEGGYLATRLSQLKKDAGKLARLLRASMAPVRPAKYALALTLANMESEVVDIVCQAESMAQATRHAAGDEYLAQALAGVGVAARTRLFLESNGVVLDRFVCSI
jgi:ATP-dependent Clp protease ATP-binding subunit ClpA